MFFLLLWIISKKKTMFECLIAVSRTRNFFSFYKQTRFVVKKLLKPYHHSSLFKHGRMIGSGFFLFVWIQLKSTNPKLIHCLIAKFFLPKIYFFCLSNPGPCLFPAIFPNYFTPHGLWIGPSGQGEKLTVESMPHSLLTESNFLKHPDQSACLDQAEYFVYCSPYKIY